MSFISLPDKNTVDSIKAEIELEKSKVESDRLKIAGDAKYHSPPNNLPHLFVK